MIIGYDRDQEENLTRNSILNSAGTLGVYCIYLIATFVSNKVLIVVLGPVVFGAWQVCFRLMSAVTLGTGPASQALKWVISNKRALGDLELLRRSVGAGFLLWGGIALFTLVAGTFLAWVTPSFIKDLPFELVPVVRMTGCILVLRLLFVTLAQLILSVLQGMNYVYRATLTKVILEVSRGVSIVLPAYLGFGLYGLAVGLLVTSLISVILYWRLVSRIVPWFGVSRPLRADLKNFSSFGVWIFAWNLVSQILFMSDVVLLGWLKGGEAVTVLIFTQYVPHFGVAIIVMIASAVTTGYGKLLGARDWARLAQVREEMMSLAWVLVMIVATGILVWNSGFVALWVGPENFAGFGVNLLLVAVFLQMAFVRLDGLIIDASLDVKAKTLWGAFVAVVSLGLGILLGLRFGLPGILSGLIIGRLPLTIVYPVLVKRSIRQPDTGRSWEIIRVLVVSVFVVGSSYLAGKVVGNVGWVGLLAGILATSVSVGVVCFYLGLNQMIRTRLKLRITRLVRIS